MRAGSWAQGRLSRKYFRYFLLLVGSALLVSEATGLYFATQETRAALVTLQREKALGAALRIEQFAKDIERQIGWTLLPSAGGGDPLNQRYVELLKLLRQVPAITEASWLDAGGREQLHVSRLTMDRIGSAIDRSGDPAFRGPKPGGDLVRPRLFPQGDRALHDPGRGAGAPQRGRDPGRGEPQVHLGPGLTHPHRRHGLCLCGGPERPAPVPPGHRPGAQEDRPLGPAPGAGGAGGRPRGPHWVAGPGDGARSPGQPRTRRQAPIPELGWVVLVEQPLAEAYAPLYAAMWAHRGAGPRRGRARGDWRAWPSPAM